MKVDKEALLKQHFWILLTLLLVLPIVCLIILWTSASAKVEDAERTVKSTEDKLTKISNPKNQKFLDKLNEKDEKVEAQKTKIWEAAWKAQADLLTWPDNLEGVDNLNKMYFGDSIPLDTRIDYERKKKTYKSQYDANIEMVLPVKDPVTGQVQFKGGQPEGVVKPSFNFEGHFDKNPPDADDLWLIQEDLAVQRELLRLIRDTNDMIGTFHKVAGAPKPDKSKGEVDHQIFTNSDFKLDLALVEQRGGVKTFRCTLTNISNRRQALGVNFLVRVKGLHDLQYFFVDGEPLAPNASIAVKDLGSNPKEKEQPKDWALQTQSGNLQGEVLEGVMQVYDWRTAPIKRIDNVVTGWQSSRTQGALEPPLFEKTEAATTPGGMQPSGDTNTGGNTGGIGGGDMAQMMGEMMKKGMRGGMFGGGGSSDKTKNGLEKNRYMSVSKQVRRMPVGLAVVMDQNHIQDFLTVVANSKLRIQTTQVYWQRFYGGDIKPSFPKEEKPEEAAPGKVPPAPAGRAGLPTFGGKFGGKFAGMGGVGEGPGGTPGMANMATMMQQMKARMTMRGGMMGGMSAGPMGGGILTGPGASSAASYDSIEPEEETNLVELAFYGIASLYERYPPKKEGADQQTAGTQNPGMLQETK
jgi:hypothetical protein